jgi:uncharacterized membrane protein
MAESHNSPQQPINSNLLPQGPIVQVAYRGPLPQAAELERYEQVLPGAAERIIKMAENQQVHRHQLENKRIEAINFSFKMGSITTLVVSLAIISVAAFSIYLRIWYVGLGAVLFYAAAIVTTKKLEK